MATFRKRAGNWEVRVCRKGYKPISKTFATKAEAEVWARNKEGKADHGQIIDTREAENTTLSEALDRYQREVTPRKKGAKQERVRLAAWKRDDLAMRSLASIRGADLAKWRDSRLAAGASPTTVRNDLALISHLFTVATKEWGLESLSNPVEKIKVPAAAPARDRRLVDDEDARLLAACEASPCVWLAPVVRLALETAMRQGEIMGLTWSQVDLKKRVVRLLDTKNGTPRNVPLSTKATAVLEALLKPAGEGGEVTKLAKGRVFPISAQVLDDYWHKALKAAEIEGLRFHDLRHEGTSRLFEKGLGIMEVATITGHKTLTMLKRYTHLKAEDLAKKLG